MRTSVMQACAVVAVVVLLSMAFRANMIVPVEARASLAPDFLLKDVTVPIGTEVRFYGGGSTGSAPLTYAWHLRNGGTADGPTATTRYDLPGVYEVALVVQAGNGRMDLDTVTVTVAEPLPGVDFSRVDAGPDRTAYEDEPVTLSASAPWPQAYAASLAFDWDLGDGLTASGASVSHVYGNAGVYHARVTVTADFGAFDRDEVEVTILNSLPVAAIGPRDVIVEEDEPLVFDASGSWDTPTDAADLAYAWEFGDGSRGAGPAVAHAYPRQGAYVATLTVTDDNGAQSSDSAAVTVVNLPPTASAGTDLVVSEGEPAMFDGSGSEDTPSDEPSLRYEWIRSPAVAPNPYPAIPGMGATHTWFDDGVHDVVLRVTDTDSAESLDLVSVTVSNAPPRATITGFWWFAEGVLLEGRAFDPGADDLTFSWGINALTNYEWRSPAEGDHPRLVTAYAFFPWAAAPPPSSFTLTVRDDDGGEGSDTVNLMTLRAGAPSRPLCAIAPIIPTSCRLPPPDREMVDNLGPRVNAGFDVAATEDLTAPFYAILEDRDPEAVVNPDPPAIPVRPDPDHRYEWSFGDGATASGNPVLHPFARAGTYTVVVTVTDRAGDVAADGLLVTVVNLDPVASLSVPAVAEDELLALASTAGDTPSDAPHLTQAWTFSDGAMATGTWAYHAFTGVGPAWIRLRVYDDNDATSEALAVVDVADVPPLAAPGGVQTVSEGQAVPLDGSASWDTATDRPRLSYTWSRDGGPIAYGWNPVLEADGGGDFTVSLAVHDEHGMADTSLFEVRVNGATPTVYAGLDRVVYGAIRDVELRGIARTPSGDSTALHETWTFGDGATGDGLSVSHAYGRSGEYTACLLLSGTGPAALDCLVVRVGVDSDGDNLLDEAERMLGTDPQAFDTDGDGLTDFYEYTASNTDPRQSDTDRDALSDWEELWPGADGYITSPFLADTDRDFLLDSVDPNPVRFTVVGAETFDYDALAVNDALGVIVAINYSPDDTIVPTIALATPSNPLVGSWGTYYDLSTSSASAFTAIIKVRYTTLPPGFAESDLVLFRYAADRTLWGLPDATGVDAANNVAWATTTHLSHWTLAEDGDQDELTNLFERTTSFPVSYVVGALALGTPANYRVGYPGTFVTVAPDATVDLLANGFVDADFNTNPPRDWQVQQELFGAYVTIHMFVDLLVTSPDILSASATVLDVSFGVASSVLITVDIGAATDPANRDTDFDGIWDGIEVNQKNYKLDGAPTVDLDLDDDGASDASPVGRDLFVELDRMEQPTDVPNLLFWTPIIGFPAACALFCGHVDDPPSDLGARAASLFRRHGISFHLVVDDLVPHDAALAPGDWTSYRDTHFTSERRGVFRYALWAHDREGGGACGEAEVPGNMHVVYDAPWLCGDQWVVYMQELGHNFLGTLDSDNQREGDQFHSRYECDIMSASYVSCGFLGLGTATDYNPAIWEEMMLQATRDGTGLGLGL
ncbi:MAG TPA: PKD domain-containing protein [Thermoplasmata archaeon]|nr:PKD domain-containing protein [Thermoplasmata archaeon]